LSADAISQSLKDGGYDSPSQAADTLFQQFDADALIEQLYDTEGILHDCLSGPIRTELAHRLPTHDWATDNLPPDARGAVHLHKAPYSDQSPHYSFLAVLTAQGHVLRLCDQVEFKINQGGIRSKSRREVLPVTSLSDTVVQGSRSDGRHNSRVSGSQLYHRVSTDDIQGRGTYPAIVTRYRETGDIELPEEIAGWRLETSKRASETTVTTALHEDAYEKVTYRTAGMNATMSWSGPDNCWFISLPESPPGYDDDYADPVNSAHRVVKTENAFAVLRHALETYPADRYQQPFAFGEHDSKPVLPWPPDQLGDWKRMTDRNNVRYRCEQSMSGHHEWEVQLDTGGNVLVFRPDDEGVGDLSIDEAYYTSCYPHELKDHIDTEDFGWRYQDALTATAWRAIAWIAQHSLDDPNLKWVEGTVFEPPESVPGDTIEEQLTTADLAIQER
jgi:hypothetical protein